MAPEAQVFPDAAEANPFLVPVGVVEREFEGCRVAGGDRIIAAEMTKGSCRQERDRTAGRANLDRRTRGP